jgi:replicative superfamily II helicase/tetratricopeptide (TPR) repeat protein
MRYLYDLEEHKIPQSYLAAWRQRWGGDAEHDIELTPLQSLVFSDPYAFEGPDLLVTGPPSSGKTFVAEVLMAHVLSHQSTARCFYLVPLRALVTEKTEEFRPIFGKEAVVPASSDYREFDQIILNGQFRICVAIYEKLFRWLANPDRIHQLMHDCSLIVVDELQMLEMQERGEKLDMILTLLRAQRKISSQESSPMRFLGLAAHKEAVTPVQEWWKARHLHCPLRPSPLFRGGILHDGYLPLRTDDSTSIPLPTLPDLDFAHFACLKDPTLKIVRQLLQHSTVDSHQKVLIFVSAKKYAQSLAHYLASVLGISRPAAAAGLTELEDTHARRLLAEILPAGVAFHHGGMITEERRFVEQRFTSDEAESTINVVVATPTLGMGVNLPADVVLIVGAKQFTHIRTQDGLPPDTNENIPNVRPLTPVEYRNMAGRAGRFHRGTTGYGICLLMQDDSTERDTITGLLDAPCPPLMSALAEPMMGLESYVLTVLAWLQHRHSIERRDIFEVFRGTFAYEQSGEIEREQWMDRILLALDRLIAGGFVNSHTLGLSRIGQEVAGTGISLFTLEHLRTLLPRVSESILVKSPFALLYTLSGVEELNQLYPWNLRFASDSLRCRKIGSRIAQFVEKRRLLPPANLETVRQGDPTEVKRLVRTLALWHWMDGAPVPKIESTGHCPDLTRGDLHWLSDRMAWLLETLCGMWVAQEAALTSDIQASRVQAEFGQMARRVLYGVPADIVQLAELRASGWHRERLMELTATSGWSHNKPQVQTSKHITLSPQLVEKLDQLFVAMRNRHSLKRQSTVPQQHINLASEISTNGAEQAIDWPQLVTTAYAASPQEISKVVQHILKLIPLDPTVSVGETGRTGTVELIVNRKKFTVTLLQDALLRNGTSTSSAPHSFEQNGSLDNTALTAGGNTDGNQGVTTEQQFNLIGSTIAVEALIQGCLEVLQQPALGQKLLGVLLDSRRQIITAEEMNLLLKVLPLKAGKDTAKPSPRSVKGPPPVKHPRQPSLEGIIAEAVEHPEKFDLQMQAARRLSKTGSYVEAQAFLSTAITLDPNRVESQTMLAWLLERQGNPEQAEELLWYLQKEYPHSYHPLFHLGQYLARQQRSDDAATVLEWAAEQGEELYKEHSISREEFIEILLTLCKHLLHIGKRKDSDSKDAAYWADRGLDICGEDPDLREVVWLSELTEDEWEGVQLGKIALGLTSRPGKEEDALRVAERAIVLSPGHWRGYDAKAFALNRLGRTKEAIAVWEQMLKTDVSSRNPRRARMLVAALTKSYSSSQPVDKQVMAPSADSG